MKKIYLLPVSLVMALTLLTWGCEKDDDKDEATCVKFDSPVCTALSFSACNDSKGEYYQYNEKKYYCADYFKEGDADDCQGASAQIVVDSKCAAEAIAKTGDLKTAMLPYNSFVLNAMKQIRAEAMAAAGCN